MKEVFNMKNAGWFLVVVSAVIIFWNVVIIKRQNEREANAHPWVTLFSLGVNLKPSYTFTPPLTMFEGIVYGMGIIGVCLIFLGEDKKEKSEDADGEDNGNKTNV